MKRIFKLLPVLAIIVATGAAWTTHRSYIAKSKADDPAYYWFNQASGTGSSSVNSTPETENQRTDATGCGTSGSFCENGYTDSQLNVSGDPSQGVKTSQVNSPAATIKQP